MLKKSFLLSLTTFVTPSIIISASQKSVEFAIKEAQRTEKNR